MKIKGIIRGHIFWYCSIIFFHCWNSSSVRHRCILGLRNLNSHNSCVSFPLSFFFSFSVFFYFVLEQSHTGSVKLYSLNVLTCICPCLPFLSGQAETLKVMACSESSSPPSAHQEQPLSLISIFKIQFWGVFGECSALIPSVIITTIKVRCMLRWPFCYNSIFDQVYLLSIQIERREVHKELFILKSECSGESITYCQLPVATWCEGEGLMGGLGSIS